VRTLLALALVLAACGRADRRDAGAVDEAPSATTSLGPDPVLVRIPRSGGTARAYIYPRLDSVVWRSSQRAPALGRVLAFDQEGGLIAYVDGNGMPGRLDLRLGRVQGATKLKLASLSSADGYGIYGVADGKVTRLTPTDNRPWSYQPATDAREVFPQPDGSLLVVGARENETVVWKLHPPEQAVLDSVVLPRTGRGVRTQVGDRVYFTVDGGLIGIRSRDLSTVPAVEFPTPVRALAPTPSGDRLYVATDSSAAISIVDRYSEQVSGTIELPGVVRDLRMDPLGRYVLARPASGDSAWVIAVGTDRVIGSVRTAWRPDLPFVAPDGSVALASGDDVVVVDGETLRPSRTVRGGAKDFWHLVLWNGFRPRSAPVDEPIARGPEAAPDTAAAADSAALASSDTTPQPTAPPAPAPDSAPAPPAQRQAAAPAGFVVQFAAVRSEEAARAAAGPIELDGQRARVITTETAGTTIYRVVLGPYPTRREAEQVGQRSGRDYWVYEGIP
jgi:cell division septation protein DedD